MIKVIYYSNILILFFLFSGCGQSNPSDLVIIENEKSNFHIYINNKNLQPLADTLNHYLEVQTGITLLVTSEIKNTPFIHLISDGKALRPTENGCYRIQNKAGNLIIQADNPEYLEYAIYDLLEKTAGISFLTPDFIYYDKLNAWTIELGENLQYCSSFGTRTVHSQLFYNNPSFAKKHKVSVTTFPYYAPGTGVHTFHRFIPRADYYSAHPEYFALRNGRRITTQLCLTNKDVLNIVIDSVQSYFDKYPEAKVISVSQDDNQQYCTCVNCREIDEREESPSGTMIHFVNKVAESFPEKTISTLAYQYTRKAPKHVKPRDNVLITLCSIECDRSAPINEKCKDFEKDLQEWNGIGAQLRIWDYTTQFTNFLAPFPNLRTLEENVETFLANNAKWVFEQHSRNPSELFELRSYVLAKLLWNPKLEGEKLIKEFCAKYYGPASTEVIEYINKIHNGIEKDSSFFLFLYGDPSQAFDSYLNTDSLKNYLSIWERAYQKVATDSIVLKRVEFASMSTIFATLERYRKNDSSFSMTIDKDGKRVGNPDYEKAIHLFKRITSDNQVSLINEMGYRVEEYFDFNNKTMDKAMKNNIALNQNVRTLTQPKKYANENPMVLTDGAFGGANFYANWLGYEGNDMEVIVDLGGSKEVKFAGISFLKVVNHIVFFPSQVSFYGAEKESEFVLLGAQKNDMPLLEGGKINDVQNFAITFPKQNIRYLKIKASSLKTAPDWHHGAGMPCWIFADEVIIN